MKVYRSKYGQLPGTAFAEVMRLARHEYHVVQKHTPRRQAYVRSRYFTKDKIFINLFWQHLAQKHPVEQIKRMKLFVCALDLLRQTTCEPESIFSNDNLGIILHRFSGQTEGGELFYVQVKHNKRTGRKDFMSVFPAKSSRKRSKQNKKASR